MKYIAALLAAASLQAQAQMAETTDIAKLEPRDGTTMILRVRSEPGRTVRMITVADRYFVKLNSVWLTDAELDNLVRALQRMQEVARSKEAQPDRAASAQ